MTSAAAHVHARPIWARPRAVLGVALLMLAVGSTTVWSVTYDSSSGALAAPSPRAQVPPSTPDTSVSDGGATTTSTGPTTSAAPAPWSAMLIGDTLLTRSVPAGADPFGGQSPALADADLAIANLETAITSRGTQQIKEYTFRSHAELATRLHDAGVDVVSLANNHSLDFGTVGLMDTIDTLDAAQVEHVGAGADLASAIEPVHRTINGVRVAVFGASQVIPAPSWVATPSRPGVASAGKHRIDAATRHLLAAVQQARATDDVVIVMMHWGIERAACPSGIQIEVAKLLRRAGATAVIGAHPHVLQPIVRDGDGVIAYSIGNFIWDPRSGPSADTGIVELNFLGSTLTDVQFHPHRLDSLGWGRAVRRAADADRIMAQVHRTCRGADGDTW